MPTYTPPPGSSSGVSSAFGRTGAVTATEADYDLDELGDVDVTSAVETQILRHNGTSFVNDYNDTFFLRVKAREAISKGEAVYIFDSHNSNVVGVKKARADSASTMPCIGIAYETLVLGDEGLIVAFGKANGIAASFTEGETMYVSPTTAGALTNTKPTGNTYLIQNVGILMQAHASNAVVKVTGVGRTNDVPNQIQMRSAPVVTDNSDPSASAVDSGKYFYRTTGATFTLPADSYIGEQYVLLNNTGSAVTIASTGGDAIIGSTSIDDDKAATILCVAANTWFVVG